MSSVGLVRPNDDAAAQAHLPNADLSEAGALPRPDRPRHRVALVVTRDIGAEESADLEPFLAAREVARDREDVARIRPPPRPPQRAVRDGELEARDRAAGFDDARELFE